MEIKLNHLGKTYKLDLSKPLDISIPLSKEGPICFFAPAVRIEPYYSSGFIGAVETGSPVNFYNITYNPHGNGTHTESSKHISSDGKTINQSLKQFHHIARVISVTPQINEAGDSIITSSDINEAFLKDIDALIIRTLPNQTSKLKRDYSGTNPTYLDAACMAMIVDLGIKHLLIDLPSVDREKDNGILAAHHIFWEGQNRQECTITELIFVPDQIDDGTYLLNLMISPLESDAVSSKPVLYKIEAIS